MFKPEVCQAIGAYVYRLVDPRNGETFYVGKGRNNRVFQHAAGARVDQDPNEPLGLKLDRIRAIHADGLSVVNLIHRHGLDDATAYQVEAALIDAYPNLTNVVRGHHADRYGIASAEDLLARYQAEDAVFHHSVLLVGVNRLNGSASLYDVTRYAWRLSRKKVAALDYILPVKDGIILGAFVADRWLEATVDNFPEFGTAMPGRIGFVGHEAPGDILATYKGKRLPATAVLSQAGIYYPRRSE